MHRHGGEKVAARWRQPVSLEPRAPGPWRPTAAPPEKAFEHHPHSTTTASNISTLHLHENKQRTCRCFKRIQAPLLTRFTRLLMEDLGTLPRLQRRLSGPLHVRARARGAAKSCPWVLGARRLGACVRPALLRWLLQVLQRFPIWLRPCHCNDGMMSCFLAHNEHK